MVIKPHESNRVQPADAELISRQTSTGPSIISILLNGPSEKEKHRKVSTTSKR